MSESKKKFKRPTVKKAKAKTASKTAKASKTKSKSGYEKGTLSKALRKAIKKNPDIGYDELKKVALTAKPDTKFNKAHAFKYKERFGK